MPSTNSILPFADDGGALLDSQAAYAASTQRPIGNQPGIALPGFVNKTLKQSNKIAVAVAQFMANRQATDVVDTLTPAQLDLMLSTAFNENTAAVLNASGTADALVANFAPAATTRQRGIQVAKALATNLTATPTLARDAQAAKIMVKGNNLPLAPGDILVGGLIAFYWDAALDKEVLINPATGIVSTGPPAQLFSQPDPTLAANAMTLPASSLALQFRNASLPSGVPSAVISGAVAAMVIPAGATLGTVSTVLSSIVEVVMNNGGTLERAVINLAGGNRLDEEGVISTTAISAGATAANVFYSTTARSNLPYRVVRRIDSTQTVAGNWATAPSLIVGAGGNALDSMSSLGYGQTWQNVSGSRALGTTYYNTTGKPILVHAIVSNGGGSTSFTNFTVNGLTMPTQSAPAGGYGTADFIVPPGQSYSVLNTGGFSSVQWNELR